LPSHTDGLSRDHKAFLDRAIDALSQDGKIVPVRLSLFAEMIKSRPWTVATWNEVHGAEGVGERFLDEVFTVSGNPKYRRHYEAARHVLKSLLPASDTDIRGTMRTAAELRTISGYEDSPRAFDELMRILVRHTRLLSPVDPRTADSSSDHPDDVCYQLTHDYLVHSLKNWLTSAQQRTRRGRAELVLAERAESWKVKQDRRWLPSALEIVRIVAYTPRRNWTNTQRAMMARAQRRLCLRALLALSLTLTALGALYTARAHSRLERLLASDLRETAAEAQTMAIYWPIIRADLRKTFENMTHPLSDEQLRVCIALTELDTQFRRPAINRIAGELLTCDGDEFVALRNWIDSLGDEVPLDEFWDAIDRKQDAEQIVRAASTLSMLDRQSERWNDSILMKKIARALVSAMPDDVGRWIEYLRPASSRILSQVLALVEGQTNPVGDPADPVEDPAIKYRLTDRERTNAATAIAKYFPNPTDLAGHLLTVPPEQFDVFYKELSRDEFVDDDTEIVNHLLHELQQVEKRSADPLEEQDASDSGPPTPILKHNKNIVDICIAEQRKCGLLPANRRDELIELHKDHAAKRKVNAAIALLRMGKDPKPINDLLMRKDDPRASSFFIHYAGRCGLTPQTMFDNFRNTGNSELKLIWVKCLGGHSDGGESILAGLDRHTRDEWARTFLKEYESESHPGLHSVYEWILGRLDRQAEVIAVRDRLAEREDDLRARLPSDTRRWYVSGEGLTFAVFQCKDMDGAAYDLAVSTCEVTKGQFRKFLTFMDGRMETQTLDSLSPTDDCPVLFVSWYEAAAYCNWLSKQEGIPKDQWRYTFRRNGTTLDADFITRDYEQSTDKDAFRDNYCFKNEYWKTSGVIVHLNPESRIGYALPKHYEWRYACLAGATTRFSFGSTEELLNDYVCYCVNSPQMSPIGVLSECSRPVGERMPNRLGLFDMHGNAYEWCSEYPQDDKRRSSGGSFPSSLARLNVDEPNLDESFKRDWKNGMRVVRRYPHLGPARKQTSGR
jgi:formylglycine-generating enzyme required for sulfatase activity